MRYNSYFWNIYMNIMRVEIRWYNYSFDCCLTVTNNFYLPVTLNTNNIFAGTHAKYSTKYKF